MTADLLAIAEQHNPAEQRSMCTGTLLPIAFSSFVSGLWLVLAFEPTQHIVWRLFLIVLAAAAFAIAYSSPILFASRRDRAKSGLHPLRVELARCSYASIVFLIYLPEYLARVQPPGIRSTLLTVIVGSLWISLALYVLRKQQNISISTALVNAIGSSVVVLLFALLTSLGIRKYLVFGYVGQDLAYFAQILHTTLHGYLFWGNLLQDLLYTKPVTTDFAGHNSPVMFLFIPFYAVFPNPITLIVLRNIVIFVCVLQVFLLARLRTSVPVAWLWSLAFLATPAVFYQATFDFYPLTFAALPVLSTIYFYTVRRYVAFWAALASCLLVREDLVFFAFGMGLLALVQRRTSRWITGPLVISAIWAFVSFAVVIPTSLHGASFVTDACFCHLGQTPSQIIHRVIFHPTHNVLLRNNIVYLKTLLTPSGIILSFGNLIAILATPYLAINLLAGGGACITNVIYAQYSLVPAIILFVSSLLVLTRSRSTKLKQLGSLGLTGSAPAVLLVLSLSVSSIVFTTGARQISEFRQPAWASEANHVLALIPAEASVAAPRYMLPHLANRDCLYQTHRLSQYHTPVYEYLVLDTDWANINASTAYQASYDALLVNSAQNANLTLIYQSPRYRVYRDSSHHNAACSTFAITK